MTFGQKTRISGENVKLESREMNSFIVSKCFMAPEKAKICQALQEGTIP
jgi:hypothetical protein